MQSYLEIVFLSDHQQDHRIGGGRDRFRGPGGGPACPLSVFLALRVSQTREGWGCEGSASHGRWLHLFPSLLPTEQGLVGTQPQQKRLSVSWKTQSQLEPGTRVLSPSGLCLSRMLP